MPEFAKLVNEDPRPLLEKLRRPALEQLARAASIAIPQDAGASVIRPYLSAAGIDPAAEVLPNGNKNPLRWKTVPVRSEDGKNVIRNDLAPVVPKTDGTHLTADQLAAHMERLERADNAVKQSGELEQQVANLTSLVERLTERLEAKETKRHELAEKLQRVTRPATASQKLQQAWDYIEKHPSASIAELSRKVGVSRMTITEWRNKRKLRMPHYDAKDEVNGVQNTT